MNLLVYNLFTILVLIYTVHRGIIITETERKRGNHYEACKYGRKQIIYRNRKGD